MAKCLCGCGENIDGSNSRGETKLYVNPTHRQRAKRKRDNKRDILQNEDIRFYCGIGEKTFNHHPVYTGPYACISPVCGRGGEDKHGKARKQKVNSVYVPDGCHEVILDSGAYSDTTYQRQTFEDALARQLKHARTFDYINKLSHIASYDVLIDEQDRDGERVKARWDVDLADYAVKKTVQAAEYLIQQRAYLRQQVGHDVGLVLSAQGVDAKQYLRCAEQIIPLLDPERDIFGLGGWCILGQQRNLLPTFFETMNVLIPMLKKYRIKRAHIWGVCFAEALGPLLWLCDHDDTHWDERNRIQLSTDSVGPTTRVVKELKHKPGHSSWGYSSWYENIPLARVLDSCKVVDADGNKAPACGPDTYCRGLLRERHVHATSDWLANFRTRESDLYRHVEVTAPEFQQLSLFGEVSNENACDIA